MDPIDAFPEHLSTTVVPVTLPDKPDALEYAARQGQVRAGIISTKSPPPNECLFCFTQRRDVGKNIQRPVEKSRQTAQKYRHENGLHLQQPIFCQKDFTFGLRTVTSGEIHLIQTTHVPMLIYELPASSLKCRAHVIRRSFEPHDQMLYHRTILEPHTAYPIPAGTHYIVLTVQKTAFGLDIIPESLLPQLLQKGFHVGDFRKMKKFNQTPYKLPPPTPIHVPAEKRPLEEKALPKKRVRPVMRRGSRRSERPMTPVPIPDVLEPVPIPDVPPVHIPQTPVQIPDVLEPVQIPDVPEPEIPDVLETTCADSRCPRTCADSRCPRTCADSRCPRTCADSRCPRTCADSRCPREPVQIPEFQNLCRFQCHTGSRTCADSSVTSPTATYADSPRTYEHSTCSTTCTDSSVTRPTATYAGSTCIRICADSSVTRPTATYADSTNVSEPVQIPVSHVPQSPMQSLPEPVQIPVSHVPPVQSLPEPMQLLPELDMLDPLESTDAFDQLMSFVFGPQELQLLHTVPSIFDENLFSFLDEREPMDLTMPRLNSCVKNIAFKPIQPMDLSVNSGQ
ncbi:uncharacterized protein TNCV_1138711 [Trichonephila clavipes]|nr:uncharacterized protein TNCV_1138711 [Trichonephila clavipes]